MRRFRLPAGILCLSLSLGLALLMLGCGSNDMTTLSAAPLSGANETPPNTSLGNGSARFEVNDTTVQYRIELHAITEVMSAHIHSGGMGEAGPVRVTLFGGPTTGAVDGTLVQSSFTSSDVQGITFEELMSQIRAGTAYVNIHTVAFPQGEVRAQLALVE